MVTKSASDRGRNVGGHWHADGSQMEHAPMASALYAMQIPPYGGETMFSNLYMAYESLSPGMQRLAESLILVHSGKMGYGGKGHVAQEVLTKRPDLYDFEGGRIDAEHPLVRVIPETGRKVLCAESPCRAAARASVCSGLRSPFRRYQRLWSGRVWNATVASGARVGISCGTGAGPPAFPIPPSPRAKVVDTDSK